MARRSFLVGYATLILILVGSLAGAALMGYKGLDLYIGEADRDMSAPGAYASQSETLESALLWWSFASLSALTAIISFIALARSIVEDLSRAHRGALSAEDVAGGLKGGG